MFNIFKKKANEENLFVWCSNTNTTGKEAAKNTATPSAPDKVSANPAASTNSTASSSATKTNPLESVSAGIGATIPPLPAVGTVKITREDALNLLLTSIAFEDFSIARLLNAEAEKVQTILGTPGGGQTGESSLKDLTKISRTSNRIFQDVISKEIIVLSRLQSIIDEINNTETSSFS